MKNGACKLRKYVFNPSEEDKMLIFSQINCLKILYCISGEMHFRLFFTTFVRSYLVMSGTELAA